MLFPSSFVARNALPALAALLRPPPRGLLGRRVPQPHVAVEVAPPGQLGAALGAIVQPPGIRRGVRQAMLPVIGCETYIH